jgi:hypothetical protein
MFCWILATAIFIVGILRGSAIAGAADQYGYVSQADLWLRGNLLSPQPIDVPWPDGQWTLSPLGYRPSLHGDAIVPTYSPGLPILLAIFKRVGGQCAMAFVLPLAAAMLVTATFKIGREVLSEQVGAAGAWLVATSPVVLFMMMSPMSDVPAATFWAWSMYGCLRATHKGVVLGGVSAAVAILIRPNLAHVALVPALWLLARDVQLLRGASRFRRTGLFAVPVVMACLFIAGLNRYLYGAVTASGYGNLETMFTLQYVKQNIVNYTTWLIRSQTPLALVGFVVLWVPGLFVTSQRLQMRGRGLLGGMSFAVVVPYVFYQSFEWWWYLRFLVPCWPAMSLAAARVLARPSGAGFSRMAKLVLLIVGLYGLYFAHDTSAFDLGETDQRYIRVARLVAGLTEPSSIVITLQHSGSLRYYGGRATLRYDTLDPQWLDRTVQWFRERGIHPYVLLDDGEDQIFKNRFVSGNVLGHLDMAKVLEYRDVTRTALYDPLKTAIDGGEPLIVRALPRPDDFVACAGPVSVILPAALSPSP